MAPKDSIPRAQALLLAMGLALAGPAAVAQAPASAGGIATGAAVAENDVVVGRVLPQATFVNTAAVSAGVGLRNRDSGAIELSGLPAGSSVTHARLYWNIISNGAPPAGAETMTIQRVGARAGAPFTVTGTVIGTGESPCWGGDRNTVYRATVPRRFVTGNGTYLVTPPAGVPGRTDGDSPWAGSTLPAYNGASMVALIEREGARTLFYEAPMSGVMFSSTLNARLYIPMASRIRGLSVLHMINSDGQSGVPALGDLASLATEQTRFNGQLISGRSSVGNDGDWNGAQGGRFTQLWDNAVRDVTALLPADASAARLRVIAGNDCLVPVAVILGRGL